MVHDSRARIDDLYLFIIGRRCDRRGKNILSSSGLLAFSEGSNGEK